MLDQEIEKRLAGDGKRLREERYPSCRTGGFRAAPGRRARFGRIAGALAAAAILAAALADESFRRSGVSPVRAALVAPPEKEPIQAAGDPLCAALEPSLAGGRVRVFFDERDVTALAEWNDHFVILDPPGPVRPGSHFFRLELTDRRGRIVGEPSWLIVTL
ncbi:MAG: hypothetical protein JW958_02075 [Candidatus Eisenbacteria bacterium]|nr:hypothetical protein [Candidatus Eisenbacteria bacterium]